MIENKDLVYPLIEEENISLDIPLSSVSNIVDLIEGTKKWDYSQGFINKLDDGSEGKFDLEIAIVEDILAMYFYYGAAKELDGESSIELRESLNEKANELVDNSYEFNLFSDLTTVIKSDIYKIKDNDETKNIKKMYMKSGNFTIHLFGVEEPLSYDLTKLHTIEEARITSDAVRETAHMKQENLASTIMDNAEYLGGLTMTVGGVVVFYEPIMRAVDSVDRGLSGVHGTQRVVSTGNRIKKIEVNVGGEVKSLQADLKIPKGKKLNGKYATKKIMKFLSNKHLVIDPTNPKRFVVERGFENKHITMRDMEYAMKKYSYSEYQKIMKANGIPESKWDYKNEVEFEKAKGESIRLLMSNFYDYETYQRLCEEKNIPQNQRKYQSKERFVWAEKFENKKFKSEFHKLGFNPTKGFKGMNIGGVLRTKLFNKMLNFSGKGVHYLLLPIFFKAIQKNSADLDSYLKTAYEVSAFYSGFYAGRKLMEKLHVKNPLTQIAVPLLIAGGTVMGGEHVGHLLEIEDFYKRVNPNNDEWFDRRFGNDNFVKWLGEKGIIGKEGEKGYLNHGITFGWLNDIADGIDTDLHFGITGSKWNLIFYNNEINLSTNVREYLAERTGGIDHYNSELEQFRQRFESKVDTLFQEGSERVDKKLLLSTLETNVPFTGKKYTREGEYTRGNEYSKLETGEYFSYKMKLERLVNQVAHIIGKYTYSGESKEEVVPALRDALSSISLDEYGLTHHEKSAVIDSLIVFSGYGVDYEYRIVSNFDDKVEFAKKLSNRLKTILPNVEEVDFFEGIGNWIQGKKTDYEKTLESLSSNILDKLKKEVETSDFMGDTKVFERIKKGFVPVIAGELGKIRKQDCGCDLGTNTFQSGGFGEEKRGEYLEGMAGEIFDVLIKILNSKLQSDIDEILIENVADLSSDTSKANTLAMEYIRPLLTGGYHSMRADEGTKNTMINQVLQNLNSLSINDAYLERTDTILVNESKLIDVALDGRVEYINIILGYVVCRLDDGTDLQLPLHSLQSLDISDIQAISNSTKEDKDFFKLYYSRLMSEDKPELIDVSKEEQAEVDIVFELRKMQFISPRRMQTIHTGTSGIIEEEVPLTFEEQKRVDIIINLIRNYNNQKYDKAVFLGKLRGIFIDDELFHKEDIDPMSDSRIEKLVQNIGTIYQKNKNSLFMADYHERFDNKKFKTFFTRLHSVKKHYYFLRNVKEGGDAVKWQKNKKVDISFMPDSYQKSVSSLPKGGSESAQSYAKTHLEYEPKVFDYFNKNGEYIKKLDK